ncbi:hypothetical protein SprV_0902675900 [Sparganum proliferum]
MFFARVALNCRSGNFGRGVYPEADHTTTTTTTTTTTIDTSGENLVYTCPRFDRTFTSHIGLVGHLQIRRTETGGSVPGAPTYTRRTRLHCPHCTRTFMYRMGLFGHMRAYEYLP